VELNKLATNQTARLPWPESGTAAPGYFETGRGCKLISRHAILIRALDHRRGLHVTKSSTTLKFALIVIALSVMSYQKRGL